MAKPTPAPPPPSEPEEEEEQDEVEEKAKKKAASKKTTAPAKKGKAASPPPAEEEDDVEEEGDEDEDTSILEEMLTELKTKVDESVSDSIKSLSVLKQIKILKGITQSMKASAKADAANKKVKKVIKPTDGDKAPAPTNDDEDIKPLVNRFKNREEWTDHFMNADKLFYKGVFKKLG